MIKECCNTWVRCPICKEDHRTDMVAVLDISENFYGEDVLKFVCPDTEGEAEAIVWSKR